MPLSPELQKDFFEYRRENQEIAEKNLKPFLQSAENQTALRELLSSRSNFRILAPGAGLMPGLEILLEWIKAIKPAISIEIVCIEPLSAARSYLANHTQKRQKERNSIFNNVTITYYQSLDAFSSPHQTLGKFDLIYWEHPISLAVENWIVSWSSPAEDFRLLFPLLMNSLKKDTMFIVCNHFGAEASATKHLIKSMLPPNGLKLIQTTPWSKPWDFLASQPFGRLATFQADHPRRPTYSLTDIEKRCIGIEKYDKLKFCFIALTVILLISAPTPLEIKSLSGWINYAMLLITSLLQITSPTMNMQDLYYDVLLFLCHTGIFMVATDCFTYLLES